MCTPSLAIRTYGELRASGLTRTQLRVALDCGSLARVRRGVYATADACDDVVRAAAHGGAVACLTAARHAGLWVLADDEDLHVWLGGDGHRQRRHTQGACPCVQHWDAGRHSPFAAPTVARMLRQILTCCGAEAFFVALESARRLSLIGPAGLRWLRAHANDVGREALELSRDDADSGLESLLRWRLRGYGLPVRTQVRITGVGVVDILIGDRLIVEADGRANHDGATMRHKDLERDARAAEWGYTTLRFDYGLIVHDWDLVERAILTAVADGRHLAPRG